ncbi:methyltransferase domain-containing protein [Micromonospora lupini]|uniref:methyltransferase domain-containing protein n=1 Tax=Micromonospora lupini TaxID=285679 RepID=UPI002259C70D|nr:methyltransferase domain-containing protein [Micromonospora lupini]MCX5065429.1 methyltransferase domain-containing protein [Micromonospora lupini]
MSQPTRTTSIAADQIAYLDTAAATAVGRDYKGRAVDALDLRPGHAVVDIGCGPGTDLGRLADAVRAGGLVVGVDRDARMLAEAARRLADRPEIDLRAGDAHALPLDDTSMDRARIDRVLMHVADPATVLTEVRRVLRPGGLVAMAEPDWDTLAVADEDVRTSRSFARFVAARVRNPTIGRELVRLSAQAGLRVRAVEAIAVVFRDFDTADRILGLRRNSARAVAAGELTDADVQPWLRRLTDGPLLAGFTLYLVTAEA